MGKIITLVLIFSVLLVTVAVWGTPLGLLLADIHAVRAYAQAACESQLPRGRQHQGSCKRDRQISSCCCEARWLT